MWAALQDLCNRGVDFDDCREDLLGIRVEAKDLNDQAKALIRMDLCGYLRKRLASTIQTSTPTPTKRPYLRCILLYSVNVNIRIRGVFVFKDGLQSTQDSQLTRGFNHDINSPCP